MKHCKWLIIGVIILTLSILLVGCVAKSKYEALQTDHNKLNTEYTNLQASYEVSQKENSNLQTDLDDLQVDYNILLEGKANLETELAEMLVETESLQEQLKDLENTMNLYRYTYGTVFSEIQPPYSKTLSTTQVPGEPITLLNNKEAVNPTWEQLKVFLGTDETDQDLYLWGSQMCGYFAEKLHNNAETAGIKCAFVALNIGNGDYHTLNAFKTIDSGLVFVDSTGREIQPIFIPGWRPPTDSSWDRIVTLRMGEKVTFENLFPERATLTYFSFDFRTPSQKWEIEWESIGTVYDIEIYW